jgi:DNA-binding NtrC family response regulator
MRHSNLKTQGLKPKGQSNSSARPADDLSSAIESLAHAQKRIAGLSPLPVLDVAQGIDLSEEVRSFEKRLIESALRYTQGNQQKAALLLNTKPSTLYHKIIKYRIK